jgi:hypothetical protein
MINDEELFNEIARESPNILLQFCASAVQILQTAFFNTTRKPIRARLDATSRACREVADKTELFVCVTGEIHGWPSGV